MRGLLSLGAAAITTGLVMSGAAWGHDVLSVLEAPAGYRVNIEVLVTHGCKGEPVKEVRLKIPEEITSVRPHHTQDWDVETKMRPLDEPYVGEGGITISETVDEVIWTNPKKPMPDNMYEGFRIRALMPKEPGKLLFFRTVNVCENGQDAYIDLPEEELDINDDNFKDKLWKFMTATQFASPFLILREADRKQYPWDWTLEQIRGEDGGAEN